MSMSGYYRVQPLAGGDLAAYFQDLCARLGLTHVTAETQPATLADIALAAHTWGMGQDFVSFGARAPLTTSATDDLAHRAAAFSDPAVPSLDGCKIGYQSERSTLDPWTALGLRTRTPVVEFFQLSLDLRSGDITLAANLDYSRSASRLGPERQAQLEGWWHHRMEKIYREHLARLGVTAQVQLPVADKPRVQLAAGALAPLRASVITENVGYPQLKFAARGDLEAGKSLFQRWIASPAFTSVDVRAVGLAHQIARLGSWVPPLEHAAGPGSLRPLPVAQVTHPAGYAGRVSFQVPIELAAQQPRKRAKSEQDEEDGSGDLELTFSPRGPKLEYSVRWGLQPEGQKRVEKLLQARLTLDDVG